MLAKHEVWKYSGAERVWAGKYKNSHNLLHWHYDCELLCVESGKIDVFCDKKIHTLTSGQSLFIGSGEVHYMHAEADTILIVIIFDNNIIKSIADAVQLKSPELKYDYNIPEVYKRLKKELSAKSPFYETALKNEITGLVINIFRNEETIAKDEGNTVVHSFKKLFAEISEKYEFISFAEAAEFMGMSQAYFSRLFHQITGMTFSRYVNYVRTENAIHMLKNDKTLLITDVAVQCGFSTIRNFNRIFKELTGFSPTQMPENYNLEEKFSRISPESFNPTLRGCELID